jgi:energy-coupling factor transport system ATP-binding protein
MKVAVSQLSYTYPGGVQALSEVSLNIEPGEKVAIIGQNGAGKTTLVRHFNGLLQPSGGSVQIGEWDTRQYSIAQLASRVGYVFQNPDDQLFSRKVKDEIEFGPRNLGFEPEHLVQKVSEAIALTELDGKEQVNPYDLSPSWRKMVALAAILAMDTPILILDEPTTGQDARTIDRIAHIVHATHAQGKTVLAITHDMDFCAENFERLVVMGQGKILLDGPTRQVIAEDEILASTYVDPPQLTRLAKRLKLPEVVGTIDDFLKALPRAGK